MPVPAREKRNSGNSKCLHSSWESPATVVQTTRSPYTPIRERHASVLALSHEQRVLHLLPGAIIIWEGTSTTPRHTQKHTKKQCERNARINAAPAVHAHQVPEPLASHHWITFTTAQSPRFPQCISRSLPYMAFSNYSPSAVAWAAFGKHKGIHFIMIAKCVGGTKKWTISSPTWLEWGRFHYRQTWRQ